MIVWSATRSNHIRWLFTRAFAQYLGRISFAVYILHGPILQSLGLLAMSTARKYIGKGTLGEECLGFLLAAVLVLPTVFWSADVFWRLVDVPCKRFSSWIEEKFMSESVETEFVPIPSSST